MEFFVTPPCEEKASSGKRFYPKKANRGSNDLETGKNAAELHPSKLFPKSRRREPWKRSFAWTMIPRLLRLYQDELSEEGYKVILDTSLKAAKQ